MWESQSFSAHVSRFIKIAPEQFYFCLCSVKKANPVLIPRKLATQTTQRCLPGWGLKAVCPKFWFNDILSPQKPRRKHVFVNLEEDRRLDLTWTCCKLVSAETNFTLNVCCTQVQRRLCHSKEKNEERSFVKQKSKTGFSSINAKHNPEGSHETGHFYPQLLCRMQIPLSSTEKCQGPTNRQPSDKKLFFSE